MEPHIYALFDPRDPFTIRYVGQCRGNKSTRPMDYLRKHTARPAEQWARGLRDQGVHYGWRVLTECPRALLGDVETLCIQAFREAGHPLLNKSDGQGMKGGHLTAEHRAKISTNSAHAKPWLGKKLSPEHRARQSASLMSRSPCPGCGSRTKHKKSCVA